MKPNNLPVAACMLLVKPASHNKVLGCARKDNTESFGLPGGKMDPEDDNDPKRTAIRELEEETGYYVINWNDVELLYEAVCPGEVDYYSYTFTTPFWNLIPPHPNYQGDVISKYVSWETFQKGPFADYNKQVQQRYFDKVALKYAKQRRNQAIFVTLVLGIFWLLRLAAKPFLMLFVAALMLVLLFLAIKEYKNEKQTLQLEVFGS